jgi:hypothetical protein
LILGSERTYGNALIAFYGCSCALFWWMLDQEVNLCNGPKEVIGVLLA